MKRVIVLFLTFLFCGAAVSMNLTDVFASHDNSPAKPETIHYQDISGDYLFVKNLDETEMMLRSLREYLEDDSVKIQSFVPEDTICLAKHSWDPVWAAKLGGGSTYCVEAWDIYKNDEFRGTTYQVGKI